MNRTYADVLDRPGYRVPPHLEPEDPVPVRGDYQAQGDVNIFPAALVANRGEGAAAAIPPEGVQVVRGEAARNTHLLVGDGTWAPGGHHELVYGTLTVPEGGTAFLLHTGEHGANGIAPGIYTLRGQREWADQTTRRVAD